MPGVQPRPPVVGTRPIQTQTSQCGHDGPAEQEWGGWWSPLQGGAKANTARGEGSQRKTSRDNGAETAAASPDLTQNHPTHPEPPGLLCLETGRRSLLIPDGPQLRPCPAPGWPRGYRALWAQPPGPAPHLSGEPVCLNCTAEGDLRVVQTAVFVTCICKI